MQDEFCPVSESAYCGAGSIHTMLLHTTGTGTLQLWSGLPPSWADAVFHKLRAARGLTVSAVRRGGDTVFVYITAAAAGNVSVEVVDDPAWQQQAPQALPTSVTPVASANGKGVWTFRLQAGESVALWGAGRPQPKIAIEPLLGNASEFNWWGYNFDMKPLH